MSWKTFRSVLRYMARKLSIPYLKVSVSTGDAEPGPAERLELTPARLVDFQHRTEADKMVIVGTFAIPGISSIAGTCLLVTQRYEFRDSEAHDDDVGAPGFREQHPIGRFLPVVQYIYIGDQAPHVPHQPLRAAVEIVQRLHFEPDSSTAHAGASAVAMFKDTAVGFPLPGDLLTVGHCDRAAHRESPAARTDVQGVGQG